MPSGFFWGSRPGMQEAAGGLLSGRISGERGATVQRRTARDEADLRAVRGRAVCQAGAPRSDGNRSDNLPMQALARRLGFSLESEQIWFSKDVDAKN